MRNLLTRYEDPASLSPYRGVSRLQRAVDRLFDDFMTPAFAPVLFDWGPSPLTTPLCELDETENEYLITMDVPGVATKDINVELCGNQLCISGERRSSRRERESTSEKRPAMSERSYGRFSQTLTLPDTVNPDAIRASCENGLLTVRVGKSERSQARQIPISEGKSIPGISEANKGEQSKARSKAA